MQCPKCSAAMERVQFQGTEIDRCTACHGLWFDMLEERDLKRLTGSEIVDIGIPSQVAESADDAKRLLCPIDKARMIRMVVPGQAHIWYESCPACHGTYFDAGEFRDYKSETFFDRVKALFTPERT